MGHYRPVIRMNIVEEPRIISQHLHLTQLDTTTSRLTIPNSTITWQHHTSYITPPPPSLWPVAVSPPLHARPHPWPLSRCYRTLITHLLMIKLVDLWRSRFWCVKNYSEKCLKPRAIFWQPSNAWNSWRAGSNIWKWVCTRGMYLRVIYRNIKKADFY